MQPRDIIQIVIFIQLIESLLVILSMDNETQHELNTFCTNHVSSNSECIEYTLQSLGKYINRQKSSLYLICNDTMVYRYKGFLQSGLETKGSRYVVL